MSILLKASRIFILVAHAQAHPHPHVHIHQVPLLAIHPPAQLAALLAVHLVKVQAAVAVQAPHLAVANPAHLHIHLVLLQVVQVGPFN